jgi:hypothetical protein
VLFILALPSSDRTTWYRLVNLFTNYTEIGPNSVLQEPCFSLERSSMIKSKFFIIPILIMAFVAVISAPPAQAELVTLTVILAAVFASAIATTEVITPNSDTSDNQMGLNSNETSSIQQAKIDLENLEATQ